MNVHGTARLGRLHCELSAKVRNGMIQITDLWGSATAESKLLCKRPRPDESREGATALA